MRIAIVTLLSLLLMTGCGGHASSRTATANDPPTLNGYGGVYLSTQNAWGKPTVIRILAGTPTSVAFVGNTYDSVSDAQAVASYGWQPNTGKFLGQVSGTIAYANPNSFSSPIEMSIMINDPTEQSNDLPTTTGTATFGVAPAASAAAWVLNESQPTAIWTEIGAGVTQ